MKSEKPTPRRLLKESKKGKSYNSRDLTAALMLIAGIAVLVYATSLQPVMQLYIEIIRLGFAMPPDRFAVLALRAFAGIVAPLTLVCILCAVLSSLAQSKGVLATEAIKIDFDRLNPVNGFKNLFSVKVVKDLVKAILYTIVTMGFVLAAWRYLAPLAFAQVHAPASQLAPIWLTLALKVGIGLLLALAPLYLLTGLVEYLLYIRELKMEKFEVKQEHKENEGNPEIKQRRRDIGAELSAQTQADVAGSNVILANPTHVAVGIYSHDDAFAMPFVSVREHGARARAVVALAERLGVPVVRDIPLARRLYARCKRYRFVASDQVDAVMQVLRWLQDVEAAARQEPAAPGQEEETPDAASGAPPEP